VRDIWKGTGISERHTDLSSCGWIGCGSPGSPPHGLHIELKAEADGQAPSPIKPSNIKPHIARVCREALDREAYRRILIAKTGYEDQPYIHTK
jgi:hypothetical protein